MDILSEYRKAIEHDDHREINTGDYDVDERVREIMDDPNDMKNAYRRYREEYKTVRESEITTTDEPVSVVLRRAKCPQCGTDIKSQNAAFIDPFTKEQLSRYDCPNCGAKFNLEHSYPRFVFLNAQKQEVNGY